MSYKYAYWWPSSLTTLTLGVNHAQNLDQFIWLSGCAPSHIPRWADDAQNLMSSSTPGARGCTPVPSLMKIHTGRGSWDFALMPVKIRHILAYDQASADLWPLTLVQDLAQNLISSSTPSECTPVPSLMKIHPGFFEISTVTRGDK